MKIKIWTKLIVLILGFPFWVAAQTYFDQYTLDNSDFQNGDIAWGDYDNDGDWDFVINGHNNSTLNDEVRIFQNDGSGNFSTAFLWSGGANGSVQWGDFDRDGDLDLLTSGSASLAIYRNDLGLGRFTLIDSGLISSHSMANWVDYDNDGDLDIFISETGDIYKNTDNNFTLAEIPGDQRIAGLPESRSAWGDYDNDGDMDVVISGGNYETHLYRNDNGRFTDWGYYFDASVPGRDFGTNGYKYADMDWGDYDNDGDLDLIICGEARNADPGADPEWTTAIYKNNGPDLNNAGNWLFAQTEEPGNRTIKGVNFGSVQWGDYNNDGSLDILLAGSHGTTINQSDYVLDIWTNNGNDTFSRNLASDELAPMGYSRARWCDYDNDGDLDILAFGYSGSTLGYVTFLYTNKLPATFANAKPAPPGNLRARVQGDSVIFLWDAADDDKTPASGLTYNVRVGSSAAGQEIVSAHSFLENGHRKVADKGNAGASGPFILKNPLLDRNYFWSVQAIDAGYAASSFSPADTFNTFSPFITVLTPHAGDSLVENTEYPIRWDYNNVEKVNIEVSLNNGGDWAEIASQVPAADRSFLWTVPSSLTKEALIRITDASNPSLSNTSEGTFAIIPRRVVIRFPNGGETLTADSSYFVNWESNYTGVFRLEFTLNDGASWSEITVVTETIGPSSEVWTAPHVATTDGRVRVTDVNNSLIQDVSDGLFNIAIPPGDFALTSPLGGEKWQVGSTNAIQWTKGNLQNIDISFSVDGGSSFSLIAGNVDASIQSFDWLVPDAVSDQCRVRVQNPANPSESYMSLANFEILDTTPPQITSLNYKASENVGKAVTVKANVTDNASVQQVVLQYRKGGTAVIQSVAMNLNSGTEYEGEIPADALTPVGIVFRVTAYDNHDNISNSDYANIAAIVSEGLNNPFVVAGTDPTSYRLFSIPVLLNNQAPDNFLQINPDLGSYDDTQFRWFSYDNASAAFLEYPQVGNLNPGRGFFFITRNNVTMSSGAGTTVDASHPFEITVPQGWSLIGNPFNFNIPYDSIKAGPDVTFKIWSYEGSWSLNTEALIPWKGYALWVTQATTLIISPGPSAGVGKVVSFYDTLNRDSKNWLLRIKAFTDDDSSTFNFFGINSRGQNNFGPLDLAAPPSPQGKLEVLFTKKENVPPLAADVLPAKNTGNQWKFHIRKSPADEKLKLTFDGIESVPENVGIFLLDELTDKAYNLRNQPQLLFAAKGQVKRDFAVIAGSKEYLQSSPVGEFVYPQNFNLEQNYPNPFNPLTQVSFTLAKNSHVKLQIYNLLGQKVATLADEFLEKGTYSRVWDATDFSSGIYFLRIKAGNYTAVKRMILIK